MAAVTHSAALALVLLLAILSTIDISTAATHFTRKPHRRPLVQPLSPAGYRSYIVFLVFPADFDDMDDAAQRAWHHSFLPTNLTRDGKQRLRYSYTFFLNGFSALFTEDEAKVLAGNPQVANVIPNGYSYKQTRRTYGRHPLLS